MPSNDYFSITRSLVVAADASFLFVRTQDGSNVAFYMFGKDTYHLEPPDRPYPAPTLINHGTLAVVAKDNLRWANAEVVLLYPGTSGGGNARIENHGLMSAYSLHGDASTFHQPNFPVAFVNTGRVAAKAPEGQAVAVRTFGGSDLWLPPEVRNAPGGEIIAQGEHAFATYFVRGDLVNEGSITALGGNIAALAVRIAGGQVTNSGTLVATADEGRPTWGVCIGPVGYNAQRDAWITNTGSIRALTAIAELVDAGTSTVLRNDGRIVGDIVLLDGADTIRNTGVIRGVVNLGADADVFDGTAGVVHGTVRAEAGDDLVMLGGADGTAFGGAGYDTALVELTGEPRDIAYTHADAHSAVLADGQTLIDLHGFECIRIATGPGKDSIRGGSGDDRFALGSGGGFLDGGPGIDEASFDFSDRADGVRYEHTGDVANATSGDSVLLRVLNIERVDIGGGDGNDTLGGASAADTLHGGAGADVLHGGDGADRLAGGEGADRIDGGAGFDVASYESSSVAVRVDLLRHTVVEGDVAGDVLLGIEGLLGSAHADRLAGDGGANWLDGGAGTDTLSGRSGDDSYVVDDPTDRIVELAGGGLDRAMAAVDYTLGAQVEELQLLGTAGIAGTGNLLANVLLGNDGDNLFEGRAGADRIDGLGGADWSSYRSSPVPVVVDLLLGRARGGDASGDVLSGIENLAGSAGDDVLAGDDGDNVLLGGPGADLIRGAGGNNTASYAGSTAAVHIDLATGTAIGGDAEGDRLRDIQRIIGSDHDDQLIGDDGRNTIDGGAGDDTIIGGQSSDYLFGGDGFDIAVYASCLSGFNGFLDRGYTHEYFPMVDLLIGFEGLIGSPYHDLLVGNGVGNLLDGTAGGDTLVGASGDDTLYGGVGRDRLLGDSGADRLSGGPGVDTLSGGLQDDTLRGGPGADVFAFDTPLQGDTDLIADFVRGEDVLHLSREVFAALADGAGLAAWQFHEAPGATAATDAAHRIVYDTTSGALYYDPDGSGVATATRFATLGTERHPLLDSTDFAIIESAYVGLWVDHPSPP